MSDMLLFSCPYCGLDTDNAARHLRVHGKTVDDWLTAIAEQERKDRADSDYAAIVQASRQAWKRLGY